MKVIEADKVPKLTKKSKFDDTVFDAVNAIDTGKAVEITETANLSGLSSRLRALIKAGQIENDVRFIRRGKRIFLVNK